MIEHLSGGAQIIKTLVRDYVEDGVRKLVYKRTLKKRVRGALGVQ